MYWSMAFFKVGVPLSTFFVCLGIVIVRQTHGGIFDTQILAGAYCLVRQDWTLNLCLVNQISASVDTLRPEIR